MKFVRPRCYFDVELSDIPLGRIVFELYSDICPITCENFRALCTGEKGIGKTTGKNLHYLNIVFHRVVKGFMIQSGDFSVGNGTGGESIYGGTFEDENFELKHDEPFLLSMANRGKDTNGSQFFVTTQPAPHLDGIHVVFGHVVTGQSVVTHIENLPVDKVNRPLQDVRVVRCNELVLKSKLKAKEKSKTSASSGSSDPEPEDKEEGEQTDSDRESKRKKKKKKEKKNKKKKKRSRKHTGSDSEEGGASPDTEEEKGPINPITGTVCKINPDEIPDVPSNKFLYRGGRQNDGVEGKREKGAEGKREKERGERKRKRENIRGYTKSGRVIKGRGVFRYRTPSRSRSRSFTPPHWKQAETRTIKLSEFQKLEEEKHAKEEEISRREEARKRRHEEREKEEKDTRNEEDGTGEQAKPQRLRRSRMDTNIQNRLGPRAETKERVEDTGPVDYNALDYDDEMEPDDTAHEDGTKVLVVNSKRSDQIVATMFSTLEKMQTSRDEEYSGDDKENTRESRNAPPLDRSPSPGTRRSELEGVLRNKLLLKRQQNPKSKSRSLSRDTVQKGRRTLSKTEGDKKDSRNGKSKRSRKDSERDSRKDRTRNGDMGENDKDDDKAERKRMGSKENIPARNGELFPDKDAVFSATQAATVPSAKRLESGDKAVESGQESAAIGDKSSKMSGNRSRDKFKTTRKRSTSRSLSRERGKRRRSRDKRSRSRDRRRGRSRSPRRRHSRRQRSSSGERSRSRDRKRASSRDRKRASRSRDRKRKSPDGKKSGQRSKRDRSADGESLKEKRSEEAKRKLTARLRELEKEREARGKERSSSSSTSSDSD